MKSTYKHFNNLQTINHSDTSIKRLKIYIHIFNKMVQSISPTAKELPAGHASNQKHHKRKCEKTCMGTQYGPGLPSSICPFSRKTKVLEVHIRCACCTEESSVSVRSRKYPATNIYCSVDL